MPSFKCQDIGVSCEFEATAKTEDKLMEKIAEHASEVHNMKTIPPDTMDRIKKVIKE